jgi:nucleoside-diphosphate-sugar epimerase
MTQRVFVTGSTGVLGRRVVRQLIESGHSVTAVARTQEKGEQLRKIGATPIAVDLFDRLALATAVKGHETVANLATNIPFGVSAVNPRAWRMNDRLRKEASTVIASAVGVGGVARLIQESITFPYVASADRWIGEDTQRSYFPLNRSVLDAERAAASVAHAGAVPVVLRFAMFMAPESAHMKMVFDAARRGMFGLIGQLDSHISFVDMEDAAAAVVAALDVPEGIYNVAEANPSTRSMHREALQHASGRSTLRTLPGPFIKLGGAGAESLTRSHRISTNLLQGVSPWKARIRCVDSWSEVAIAQGKR